MSISHLVSISESKKGKKTFITMIYENNGQYETTVTTKIDGIYMQFGMKTRRGEQYNNLENAKVNGLHLRDIADNYRHKNLTRVYGEVSNNDSNFVVIDIAMGRWQGENAKLHPCVIIMLEFETVFFGA